MQKGKFAESTASGIIVDFQFRIVALSDENIGCAGIQNVVVVSLVTLFESHGVLENSSDRFTHKPLVKAVVLQFSHCQV